MGALTKYKLSVDTSALAESDQVWSYLSDDSGNLLTSTLVGADQALDVNVVQSSGTGSYAEDTAHTTADIGQFILAVRTDSKASTAGTDGDYAALIQDADGDLYVTDTVSQGYLATIDADTGNILADTTAILADTASMDTNLGTIAGAVSGTEMQVDIVSMSGQYAEDSAHTTADLLSPAGVVRSDTLSSLCDTDGDYTLLQVNADGALYVDFTDTVIATSGAFAEDAAHTTGDVGVYSLAVAQHGAFSANHSADGDYASFMVDAYGRLIVNSSPNVSAKNSNETVGVAAAEVVSTPLAGRTHITIQNNGNKSVYVGFDGTVSTTNGLIIPPDSAITHPWGADINIFMISGTAGQDVRFLEVA